jgi:hypothetical protein
MNQNEHFDRAIEYLNKAIEIASAEFGSGNGRMRWEVKMDIAIRSARDSIQYALSATQPEAPVVALPENATGGFGYSGGEPQQKASDMEIALKIADDYFATTPRYIDALIAIIEKNIATIRADERRKAEPIIKTIDDIIDSLKQRKGTEHECKILGVEAFRLRNAVKSYKGE